MAKRREYVTQAEFARRIQVTRQYVGKLVKKGILKKCRNGKLDMEKSLDAIEQIQDPAYQSKADLEGARNKPAAKKKAARKASKKQPKAPAAVAEIPPPPPDPEDGPDLPQALNGRVPRYSDSKAMREFWLARKARQDFLRAERDLLPRNEVERDLFNALRPLRETLLSAPGRMAGVIAPMSDAAEVEHALETEIRSALEEVVDAVEAVLSNGR